MLRDPETLVPDLDRHGNPVEHIAPACPYCLGDAMSAEMSELHAKVADLTDLVGHLQAVITASTDLDHNEAVPRRMWTALGNASDALAQFQGIPF